MSTRWFFRQDTGVNILSDIAAVGRVLRVLRVKEAA